MTSLWPSSYKDSLVKGLELLLSDPHCFLIGEDVQDPYGGAFAITKGLSTRFPGKVVNTPMSEQGFTGMGVGMALAGFRPIIEIMFGDFSTLILDQLLNHAAKFVEGFDRPIHMAVRTPMGGYRGYGATHSQSLERLLVGWPHIAVVSPSVLNAPGQLLVKSMELGVPVFFVENKLDYTRWMFLSETMAEAFELQYHGKDFPIIEAGFPNEEAAVTVISYGGMVHPLLHLMYDLYMEEEVAVRLLDISMLHPLDVDLIYSLVKNERRILTVEEGPVPFGVGDGIISEMAQRGVKARFQRVGARQHIIGASLDAEKRALPQMDEIKAIILEG